MAQGIAARTLFAFWRRWPGAFQSIAAVGFDLSELIDHQLELGSMGAYVRTGRPWRRYYWYCKP